MRSRSRSTAVGGELSPGKRVPFFWALRSPITPAWVFNL